jgi:hypothetical protein
MQSSGPQAVAVIRELGSVEQLRDLAEKSYAPSPPPKVNSHVHLPPNFSAFHSVQQAVSLAKQQCVRVLGVSNYYDFSVYEEFARQATELAIFPLFGLEIITMLDELAAKGARVNDPNNPGKMYICGKGITRFADPTLHATELIRTIRQNDDRRMAEMIGRLDAIFSSHGLQTNLNNDAVIDGVVGRHGCHRQTVTLQERHVGRAFQKVLFEKIETQRRSEFLSKLFGGTSKVDPNDPVAIQAQIRSHFLKAGRPAFVDEAFLNLQQAYELILELGGIPCYPVLADGADPLCEYETPVEKLIETLKENNIHMAELIPVRNQPSVLSHYVTAMRAAGIALIAGTEHNTLELLPIEPSCAGKTAVPKEIEKIFVEGAYIVAAHQFLMAHGQQGYVDQSGNLNKAYETAERRISAFAKLGAAVIQKYYDTN